VKILEELYAKEGQKRLNYYYSLIIRGTTMQNRDALTIMEDLLAQSPHIHNELLDNPFYVRWTAKGKAQGRTEGKTESAINLMRNMGVDAERAAELLGFSAEDRAALFAHLSKVNGHPNDAPKTD
jgi:hypothetical protein